MKNYNITVNGKSYSVQVEEVTDGQTVTPVVTNVTPAPAAKPAAPAASKAAQGGKSIKAPMPGTILKINVKAGDAVKKGQVLLVLEAMKMENDITAPEDGVVASVNVQTSANVNSGDVLVSYN